MATLSWAPEENPMCGQRAGEGADAPGGELSFLKAELHPSLTTTLGGRDGSPIVLMRKLSLSTHHTDRKAGGQLRLHPPFSMAEPWPSPLGSI